MNRRAFLKVLGAASLAIGLGIRFGASDTPPSWLVKPGALPEPFLMPPGKILVIGTPYVPDDLYGRLRIDSLTWKEDPWP